MLVVLDDDGVVIVLENTITFLCLCESIYFDRNAFHSLFRIPSFKNGLHDRSLHFFCDN